MPCSAKITIVFLNDSKTSLSFITLGIPECQKVWLLSIKELNYKSINEITTEWKAQSYK